jgi:DNA-binding NarL/FixJ family response regulator
VDESYRNGANGYVLKPFSFTAYVDRVAAVGRYWTAHNRSCGEPYPQLDAE